MGQKTHTNKQKWLHQNQLLEYDSIDSVHGVHDLLYLINNTAKEEGIIDVVCPLFRIQDFEYTPECIIFDLLRIPLYHGWLVDPQDSRTVEAVGNCSYNQLVEKIIGDRSSEKEELVNQGNTGLTVLRVESLGACGPLTFQRLQAHNMIHVLALQIKKYYAHMAQHSV